MIALTAGEPPLEVPRTPFALFCSSMKRNNQRKKTCQNFRDLFRQTVSCYFSSLPLFPFPLTMFWVCTIFHCPLGFCFGGGEWRGWQAFIPPAKTFLMATGLFRHRILCTSSCILCFLTYALQSCIGAFCLSEL